MMVSSRLGVTLDEAPVTFFGNMLLTVVMMHHHVESPPPTESVEIGSSSAGTNVTHDNRDTGPSDSDPAHSSPSAAESSSWMLEDNSFGH